MSLGPVELIIVLAIVLPLFGSQNSSRREGEP
jgi:Sec-independent protein translocase protein TatA